MTSLQIPHWNTDRIHICEAIEQDYSPLKIALKTRNDKFFLKKWIDYHLKIVRPQDLIIFDNESDDPEVLDLYSKLENIKVFRFSGFHNLIHRTGTYPQFYESLRKACQYFIFLDTDEMLTWVNDDGFLLPPSDIVPTLQNLAPTDLVIGSWVENAVGREDQFRLFTKHLNYPTGLRRGKSVLSTRAPLDGDICHNFQTKGITILDDTPANILILHLNNLNPEQRLNANLQKLKKWRFNGGEFDVDYIKTFDLNQLRQGKVKQYVREIQILIESGLSMRPTPGNLRPGEIRLHSTGQITFFSPIEREAYLGFLRFGGRHLKHIQSLEIQN